MCYLVCRYLEENVGALAVQLTAEELEDVEAAFPHDKVSGHSIGCLGHSAAHDVQSTGIVTVNGSAKGATPTREQIGSHALQGPAGGLLHGPLCKSCQRAVFVIEVKEVLLEGAKCAVLTGAWGDL